MYTSISAIFTFAMVASAALTARQVGNSCGNTGALSCCNPSDQATTAGGLLALAGTQTLGGNSCQQIPADVANIPVTQGSDICGGNTAYCCEDTNTNQVGLINLSTTCTPLDLAGLL